MTGMEGSLKRAKSAPLAQACWTKFWAKLWAKRSAFARTLIVAGLLIGAIWLVAMSRWILTDSVVPWDSKNQFYAFYRFLASALAIRRVAVLESVSLWRPSERRRSAVADLRAAVGALCAVRSGAVAARVRSARSRASADRRIGGRRDRRARALAGGRLRAGGGGVHVRRRRRRDGCSIPASS